MELKVKKLSEKAVLPIRAHEGDAGFDLTCTRIEQAVNEARQILLVYHTDLAIEIPEGHVGLLFPRSSIYKKSISLTNAVGVIDSGYRGEVTAVFLPTTSGVPTFYVEGERFAQLVIVPIPQIEVIEVDELTPSECGEGGFGSTGNTNKEISAATGSQSLPEDEDESINSETASVQAADQNGSEQA